MGVLTRLFLLVTVLSGNACMAQGSIAPAIRLVDAQGQLQDIRHFIDRPAIVHFWASWCGPCLQELPVLSRRMDIIAQQGIDVILIAADSRAAIRQFLQQSALEVDVLIDQYGKAMRDYRIKGLPTTVFIDSNGRVARQKQGATDWANENLPDELSGLLVLPVRQ